MFLQLLIKRSALEIFKCKLHKAKLILISKYLNSDIGTTEDAKLRSLRPFQNAENFDSAMRFISDPLFDIMNTCNCHRKIELMLRP